MKPTTTSIIFGSDELDVGIREVAAAGFPGLEMQPHHTLRLLDTAERQVAERSLAQHGLEVAALTMGGLRDESELALQVAGVDLADSLAAQVLVILPPTAADCEYSRFLELLRELAAERRARTPDLSIAVHHHAGTIVATPGEISALLDDVVSDGVGLCFDTAHYALFADDETAATRRWASAIEHVHLKDVSCRRTDLTFTPDLDNGIRVFRLPGEGLLDLSGVVRALDDGGYEGWISVEIESLDRSRADALAAAREFLEEDLDHG